MARILIDITEETRERVDEMRRERKVTMKRLVLDALGLYSCK